MTIEGERSPDQLVRALELLRKDPLDEVGWRIIYTTLWPVVLASALRMTKGDLAEAQDQTQEAFIRLLRFGPRAEFESPAALYAYVRRILTNVSRDSVRLAQRRPTVSLDSVKGSLVASADPAAGTPSLNDLQEGYRRLAEQLTARERRLFDMLVEQLSIGEIAESLGLTYHGAAMRISRLRRRLEALAAGSEATTSDED